MTAAWRPLSIILALGTVQACVPRDAGYDDVRRGLRGRTGRDANWRHVQNDANVDRRTRELLAKPLTADAAVQVALYNNPDVQASFEDLGLARAAVVEAFRLPNPTVGGALHFHGEGDPDIDLQVMESISGLLFLPSRNSAARAELDAAKLAVVGKLMDIVLDVRIAYYRYQASQQIAELRRSMVLAANASYDAAQRLHEAGNITDLDLANEQALYEEARLALSQADTEHATQRERLTALMGLWGAGASWKAAARLEDPQGADVDSAELERRALERSLDLDLARSRYAASAKRANVARAEGLVPDLKGGVSIERDEGDWGYGPAAEIELPLFYQGQGAVDRARSEMRRQASVHSSLGVRIRAAARTSVARLVNARDRALFYKRVLLPLRERIVHETQLQFNAMNASVFQLLIAKRDQIEAARGYVEALRDYWIARAELDQLLAGRLVSDGAPAEQPVPAPSAPPLH